MMVVLMFLPRGFWMACGMTTDFDETADLSVAVIIPYYNGSKFIERALASVAIQTYRAREILVVNDGSTQAEREALLPIAEKYNARVINKINGGQGSARNAGVLASNSSYLSFLDQDDFYLPEHNQILIQALSNEESRFGFIYADLIQADGHGQYIRSGFIKDRAEHPKKNLESLLREDMFVLPSASLISRVAFEAIGGFDEQFRGYEDDDLFLRIFLAGYSNNFISTPVTVWCIHTESTSYSIHMSRSRFRFLTKLAGMFPDDERTGRYYFAQYLVPRFSRTFLIDAAGVSVLGAVNIVEVISILQEFVAMVNANQHVSRLEKLRLNIMAKFIIWCPRFMIKIIATICKAKFIRAILQKVI
jgi:glycosyltransferase involved in cell wall biosynthesis